MLSQAHSTLDPDATADMTELLMDGLKQAAFASATDVHEAIGDLMMMYDSNLTPTTASSLSGRIFDGFVEQKLIAAPSPKLPARSEGKHEEEDDVADNVAAAGAEGEDEYILAAGQCMMCERHMPMSRHHLIPRAEHARFRKKGYSQAQLSLTVDLCRPCHSAVHTWEDETTLAHKFSSLDSLLGHPRCVPWLSYISKQRVSASAPQRYRR